MKPISIIESSAGSFSLGSRELWEHRDLLYHLIWREIRISYVNSVLGFFWLILQPLIMTAITTALVTFFLKFDSGDLPYAALFMSGMVIWSYYSIVISRGCSSLVANAYLLSKVYFPRLFIPAVPILAGLVDFAVLLLVLFALLCFYKMPFGYSLFILPLPIVLIVFLAIGMSLWLSALNAIYRDVGNFLNASLQIGMYLSPVLYPSSLVPDKWKLLYSLNPLVGIIDCFRWALFMRGEFPLMSLGISCSLVVIIMLGGIMIFRNIESTVADVI